MNFTEVVSEVLRIVERPDKLRDIQREVNAAINSYSADTFFAGDFVELNLPTTDQLAFAIPLTDTPRLRSIKYIKRGATKIFLIKITSQMLFDSKCDLRNTYYLAGNSIKINLAEPTTSIDIGYYEFPPFLTDAAPQHWMLDGYWPMVVDRAAARVFLSLGDDSSARLHESAANAAYLSVRQKLTHWA